MLSLSQADNGRTVAVPLGETVRISLPENATTGYRWAVDRYDHERLEALPDQPGYAADAIGSGGHIAFAFRVKQPGAAEIALKHWRHWEGDASVTERFRLQLTVRP